MLRNQILLVFSILMTCLSLSNIGFATVTNWVDIKIQDGHILLPAKLNGHPVDAVLDTGASVVAVSGKFFKENNLERQNTLGKITVSGVHGDSDHELLKEVSIELFGVELKANNVVLAESSDKPLILGHDFFKHFIVQIDYPNKRLRLANRASINLEGKNNIESRRDPVSNMIVVKTELNGQKEVWLQLDTGNAGGIFLRRMIATSKGWLNSLEIKSEKSHGFNMETEVDSFRLPKLKIGPYEIADAKISVPKEDGKYNLKNQSRSNSFGRIRLGYKSSGILGYDILKHFLVTIDFEKGLVDFGIGSQRDKKTKL